MKGDGNYTHFVLEMKKNIVLIVVEKQITKIELRGYLIYKLGLKNISSHTNYIGDMILN